MMLKDKDRRVSLQYEDYDDYYGLEVSKDRKSSVFGEVNRMPLKTANFNVYAPNVSSSNSSQLLDIVNALSDSFKATSYSSSIHFEPTGCEWKVILTDKGLNKNDKNNYWIHGMVLDGEDDITHKVFLSLIEPTKSTIALKYGQSEKRALKYFESMRCIVHKMLCRLEFPDFPEGNSGKSFRSVYQLNEKLSNGSYGVVFQGRHRETDKKVAVKSINRKKLTAEEDAAIFSEVAIMANMNHPNIIKVIDFFEEKDHYLIVMEYLEGGDLFGRIGRKNAYNESDAKKCSAILLDAINYCHSNSVAHLDLKTQNLVLTSENDDTQIKLIDFGFSQRVFGHNSLTRCYGTPSFVAPEIISNQSYDERADMWSVGVIIYVLLSGELPFTGMDIPQLYKNVLKEKVEFKGSSWKNVSQDAKKLILGLLDKNPDTRLTAEQAISSSWFQKTVKNFRSVYQLNEKISNGSYSDVFQGRHRDTNGKVTVNCINRKKLSSEEDAAIFSQVETMVNMKHQNAVKIIDFFEEKGHYLVVMKYQEGGDLFDQIGRKKVYNYNENDKLKTISAIIVPNRVVCKPLIANSA